MALILYLVALLLLEEDVAVMGGHLQQDKNTGVLGVLAVAVVPLIQQGLHLSEAQEFLDKETQVEMLVKILPMLWGLVAVVLELLG